MRWEVLIILCIIALSVYFYRKIKFKKANGNNFIQELYELIRKSATEIINIMAGNFQPIEKNEKTTMMVNIIYEVAAFSTAVAEDEPLYRETRGLSVNQAQKISYDAGFDIADSYKISYGNLLKSKNFYSELIDNKSSNVFIVLSAFIERIYSCKPDRVTTGVFEEMNIGLLIRSIANNMWETLTRINSDDFLSSKMQHH